MKFDKFLKENDAKRARAIKKSAEEQELCKKKGISRTFMVPHGGRSCHTPYDIPEKLMRHSLFESHIAP